MSVLKKGYVQGMIKGEELAFAECYQELSPTLYSQILRICANKETANDLLHDTFIRIFDNIHLFNESQEFIAWAKRIAFNVTFNYLKKAGRQSYENIDNISLCSLDIDMQTNLENQNLLDLLFIELSEIERLVLWLFIVEQYTHEDISQLVEKSVSYSKSIVSRTLKKLEKVRNNYA